jgi:ATP-dependent DNA helicase RecG
MKIFNGSVKVMRYQDRLEVWNPGTLPPTLTLEKLRGPHASFPYNLLLAEPMYLTKYIERMGTGIRDMIRRCRAAGLPELEIRIDGGFFVLTIRRKKSEPGVKSAPSRAQVLLTSIEIGMINACAETSQSSQELLSVAGCATRTGNFKRSMEKLLTDGLLVMTIPEKPNSRNQGYVATAKGQKLLQSRSREGDRP